MKATPQQLHAALMYCIDFARVMLEDSGEFYPFGCRIDERGEVVASGADIGEKHPKMQDVFTFLESRFEQDLAAAKIIGFALAVNVNIPSEYSPQYPDGIRVTLKAEGYDRFVYVPYHLSSAIGRTKDVTMAQPFAVGRA